MHSYKKTVVYDPLKSETYRFLQEQETSYAGQQGPVQEVTNPIQPRVFQPNRLVPGKVSRVDVKSALLLVSWTNIFLCCSVFLSMLLLGSPYKCFVNHRNQSITRKNLSHHPIQDTFMSTQLATRSSTRATRSSG